MAITVQAMTLPKKAAAGKTFFGISFYSADASGGEEIKAAPTAGSIYIERLSGIVLDADGTIVIGDGTTDIKIIGSVTAPIPITIDFKYPVKLAATTALSVTATAGAISGYVEGFIDE